MTQEDRIRRLEARVRPNDLATFLGNLSDHDLQRVLRISYVIRLHSATGAERERLQQKLDELDMHFVPDPNDDDEALLRRLIAIERSSREP